jgi:hypothetical protein
LGGRDCVSATSASTLIAARSVQGFETGLAMATLTFNVAMALLRDYPTVNLRTAARCRP